MKKQALFLAAATAAVISGSFASRSVSAAEAGFLNKTSGNEVLVNALYDKATITQEEGAIALIKGTGQNGKEISGDLASVTKIVFDCSDGDPLAGATDWRGLRFFTNLNSIKLCSAEGVDWDELAMLSDLDSLSISPINNLTNMEDADYLALRDATEGKPVVDISGIGKLSGLDSLTIVGVPLGNLQTITDLPYVSFLNLNADYITSIDGLNDMPNLQYVNFDFSFNNIQDAQPLMDFCVAHKNCTDGDWLYLAKQGLAGKVYGNRMVIETDSETPELPGLLYGILKMIAEPGITEGEVNPEDYIATEGLSYSYDNKAVKLDTGASKHIFKIASPLTNEEWFSVEYKYTDNTNPDTYTGNTNPDTADNFSLAWVMGIAAAIMATTSFVIRSRR